MLFGRSEPEKVRLDELDALAARLFEKRLGSFGARSEGTIRSMARAAEEFADACERLGELNAEPYMEDLYFASASSIKGQKALYAKAIKRIISEMNLEIGEGANAYEKSKAALMRVDSATNEMLKTNAGFKTVLYSYSNHMGAFKRAFSAIERLREELHREIESRSGEAREYEEVMREAEKLRLTLEEIRIFRESMDALGRSLGGADRKGAEAIEERILKDLAEKKGELAEANAQASRLSERISLMTAPLERPSRKQDHLSLKKIHISEFISDPINRIRGEEDYSEFSSLLKEMRENVESGKIDTKNREGTLSAINALMDFDIRNAIDSLRSLRERGMAVSDEIRTIERTIGEIKKGREGLERSMKDISLTRERAEAAERSVDSIKASIEKMFSEYYRKPISILL